uniref:Uncharacterized protein n=1 Tax=Octopus bimaculoides TaxID=37653 RepID=A0A0L8HW88_OCTBM
MVGENLSENIWLKCLRNKSMMTTAKLYCNITGLFQLDTLIFFTFHCCSSIYVR